MENIKLRNKTKHYNELHKSMYEIYSLNFFGIITILVVLNFNSEYSSQDIEGLNISINK
jgi:hypothetical protein